jgi:predicted thioesterase
MRQIPLGAKGSFSLLVRPEHLANRFKDAIRPQVSATPVMILVMENAALNAIRAYLDPVESAVGTAVNVRHLAATPVGRLVTEEAEVTKVDEQLNDMSRRRIVRPRIDGDQSWLWHGRDCRLRPGRAAYTSAGVRLDGGK